MTRLDKLDVLRTFSDLQTSNGLVPSVRELGEALGVTGAAVQRHINALVEVGYLSRHPFKSRSLAITAAGRALLA